MFEAQAPNLLLKSEIIRKFRTQSDFAAAADVDETMVSKIIRMRRTLSEEEAQRWADLLEWPESYSELFGETRG